VSLQTLFAWLLLALIVAAAVPVTQRLLARSPHPENSLLALTLAPGLASGTLTLIMFWESLLGGRFSAAGVTLPYFMLALGAYWLLRPQRDAWGGEPQRLARPRARRRHLIMLPLLLVAAAILFNAAYWPFSRDDALAIYRPFAQMMAGTGTLVPLTGADSLYRAYPMHMPLAYAWAYLASGWENEYLARLFPALLSAACLPAVFLLGRRIERGASTGCFHAGWWAALLLAFTPFFGRWASAGYVDLPMAYYIALTALLCARLWASRSGVDALLAGVCLALAAWTKNAALLAVPLFAGWLIYAGLRRTGLRPLLIAFGACALVGAPWYARNVLGAGFVIPQTAWTDQAQPTLANLFPFVTQIENFGIAGWIMTAGMLWTAVRARRSAASALLLWGIVPYLAVWWLLVSYDPRFLLHVLPLMCTLGGLWLAQMWRWLDARWGKQPAYVSVVAALAAAVIALTLQALWQAVEFKDALRADPLMSHSAKVEIVRPGIP
jgi:4-amino-4-deoxy-L-arabinose transferase-like glycosyltransferase